MSHTNVYLTLIRLEEELEKEPPVAAHARRASATIATRLTQPPSSYASEAHTERATNLLRRLSLGPALPKVIVTNRWCDLRFLSLL